MTAQVLLVGRVSKDPALRFNDDGSAWYGMTVVENDVVFKDGADQVVAYFWSVSGTVLAVDAEDRTPMKGDQVHITGRLLQDRNAAKGEPHTKIRVETLTIITRARGNSSPRERVVGGIRGGDPWTPPTTDEPPF